MCGLSGGEAQLCGRDQGAWSAPGEGAGWADGRGYHRVPEGPGWQLAAVRPAHGQGLLQVCMLLWADKRPGLSRSVLSPICGAQVVILQSSEWQTADQCVMSYKVPANYIELE